MWVPYTTINHVPLVLTLMKWCEMSLYNGKPYDKWLTFLNHLLNSSCSALLYSLSCYSFTAFIMLQLYCIHHHVIALLHSSCYSFTAFIIMLQLYCIHRHLQLYCNHQVTALLHSSCYSFTAFIIHHATVFMVKKVIIKSQWQILHHKTLAPSIHHFHIKNGSDLV